MTDELLPYYNKELAFIRQMSTEFAEKYPSVAGRLQLNPDACDDPHVARLIESFALLAGRIHHKLDDEFPEITEAVLDVLYPHLLKPVPPMAVVQFQLDPSQSPVAAAIQVPVGTAVNSQPVDREVCSFRTCYPVSCWPIRVTNASVSPPGRLGFAGLSADTAAVVRIEMECLGTLRFGALPIDALRFYLKGDSTVVHALYEALFLNALQVSIRAFPAHDGSSQAILPPTCLRQVGFGVDEGLLPYSDRSFAGYRVIQEYFAFPEKFLFVDVVGLNRVPKADFGNRFEILISLSKFSDKHRLIALEQGVGATTFQLGCTPVVNLFERIAEPIRVNQAKTEYRIIPDQHRQMSTEIYSVDRVMSTASYDEEPQEYQPFYALRHRSQNGSNKKFWYTHRRPSFRKGGDNGTEVYLTLVDLEFKPSTPPVEILTLRVTCTNRDYATRLLLEEEPGELQAEGVPLLRVRSVRKPTATARPPLRRALQWRLVSHLSLNHLSIVEKGRDALQEILRLYNFTDDPTTRKQIEGISAVASRASVSRVTSQTGVAFCRGTDVAVTFDDDYYIGTGPFLLASVLERFLGLYSAVNSFSRLKALTKKGVLKQWPPRAGEQILL